MSTKMRFVGSCAFALFATSLTQGCALSDGSVPEDGQAAASDEEIGKSTEALLPDEPQAFRLVNFGKAGKCAGVRAALDTEWTPFIIWDCLDTANQKFRKDTSINDGEFFRLKDLVAGNRCVAGFSNWPAVILGCDNSDAERWKQRDIFTDANGRECFKLERKGSGNQVLSVWGGKVQNNATVGIYSANAGTADQIWCSDPVSSP